MRFSFLYSCWLITCGLPVAVFCQGSDVTQVLEEISTITQHATSVVDIVTSLNSPQGLYGQITGDLETLVSNVQAIHNDFEKVNGGLTKATADTNALSGPSATDMLRISQAATNSKIVIDNAIAEVKAKENTFNLVPTAGKLVEQDLQSVSLAFPMFDNAVASKLSESNLVDDTKK